MTGPTRTKRPPELHHMLREIQSSSPTVHPHYPGHTQYGQSENADWRLQSTAPASTRQTPQVSLPNLRRAWMREGRQSTRLFVVLPLPGRSSADPTGFRLPPREDQIASARHLTSLGFPPSIGKSQRFRMQERRSPPGQANLWTVSCL